MDATLLIPNAILFILDPSCKDVIIPDYVDGALISASDSCVSVGAQSDIDGEVYVELMGKLSSAKKKEYMCVFRGEIITTGRKLALVTSEFDRIVEKTVYEKKTDIIIWANDYHSPNKIIFEIC